MFNRAAMILAVAALISSLGYAGLAQVPERPRVAARGAIVAEPPVPGQVLPGRYQVTATSSSAGSVTMIVLDTHTGHCWSKSSGQSWYDAGSPVKQE